MSIPLIVWQPVKKLWTPPLKGIFGFERGATREHIRKDL
jgi:hypothetical protein